MGRLIEPERRGSGSEAENFRSRTAVAWSQCEELNRLTQAQAPCSMKPRGCSCSRNIASNLRLVVSQTCLAKARSEIADPPLLRTPVQLRSGYWSRWPVNSEKVMPSMSMPMARRPRRLLSLLFTQAFLPPPQSRLSGLHSGTLCRKASWYGDVHYRSDLAHDSVPKHLAQSERSNQTRLKDFYCQPE